MMRSVRLTLWHMLLVVALVVGAAAAVLAGLARFAPWMALPWLQPLLAGVAADAVATQRVVTRERLDLSEQGALRAAELVVVVLAVRLASLAAEQLPLMATAATWVRDPLAFFTGQFATYLLPSFLVWFSAIGVAQAVLQFETELPQQGWRGLPNDEAGIVEERAQAVARFDRYWLMYTLLSLTGASAALYGMSLAQALGNWDTARPLVAVLGVVLAGLLLHSQGQFDQLAYGWLLGQVEVAPDVSQRAQSSSRLLSIVALLFGLVLGGVALLIPPPPLVPVLNALLLVGTLLVALVVALMGLLLLPLAWLLSLFMGTSPPQLPSVPQLPVAQIPQPTPERPLLPALIFWSCVLVLVGIAALRYVQQRRDLRVLVARWPGLRWLLRRLGAMWSEAQSWSGQVTTILRQQLLSRRRPARRRMARLSGAQAQLHALYGRLIRAAEQHGVNHPPSQTPYEFRAAVGSKLPSAAADVEAVTDVYVTAEYGPAAPAAGDVRRARRAWRRALRVLARGRGMAGRARGGSRYPK